MTGSFELSLSRELFVPRELVFDAWTDAAHLAQWYSPRPDGQRGAVAAPHPGGAFEARWQDASGTLCEDAGVYLEVHRPEGFRCRLRWRDVAVEETELTVSLTELGGASRIHILQEGFSSAAARDRRRALWGRLLDRLEGYFAVI